MILLGLMTTQQQFQAGCGGSAYNLNTWELKEGVLRFHSQSHEIPVSTHKDTFREASQTWIHADMLRHKYTCA